MIPAVPVLAAARRLEERKGQLERLRLLDEVAYMRFASVYKNFDGAADFQSELELLSKMASPVN